MKLSAAAACLFFCAAAHAQTPQLPYAVSDRSLERAAAAESLAFLRSWSALLSVNPAVGQSLLAASAAPAHPSFADPGGWPARSAGGQAVLAFHIARLRSASADCALSAPCSAPAKRQAQADVQKLLSSPNPGAELAAIAEEQAKALR